MSPGRGSTADVHMAPPIAEILHTCPEPFVQVIYDIDVPRMAFGRIALIGDAAFAVRPHAGAGTAKACADAWTLRDALRDGDGDPAAALARWEPGQLALGRQLLERTREMGDRSQFLCNWIPGEPGLPPRAVRAGTVDGGPTVWRAGGPARARVRPLAPVRADRSGGATDRRRGGAYGLPNVATRSMRHSNSTRFSSIAGSRRA